MKREPNLIESMDQPDCDLAQLINTYRQFKWINRLFARPGTLYSRYIRPVLVHCSPPATILDIGCGGGDLADYIARRAALDGLSVQITAIDTDHRSLDYARGVGYSRNITFLREDISGMVAENKRFDLVISNHLLHHIATDEIILFLERTACLAKHSVIMSDIHRSQVSRVMFGFLTRPFFFNSYVVQDGITSIRRSYTPDELQSIVPFNWVVDRLFPFRIMLVFRHPSIEESKDGL